MYLIVFGLVAAAVTLVMSLPDTVSLGEALRIARATAAPGALVVISGSLYLVGEVKKLLSR